MNIRQKIQAIIDKARSTTFEGEAESLFAKAAELMEQHQIEHLDGDENDPISLKVGMRKGTGPSAYRAKLQCALGGFYGLRPVWSWTKGDMHAHLIGPESAHVTLELMEPFVWEQVTKVSKKIAAEQGLNLGAVQRRVINNLLIRIHAEKAKNEHKPAATAAATKNALVLKSAIDAITEKMFPNLRDGRKSKVKTGSSAIRDGASGISLHRQATGSTTLRLK